MTTTPLPVQEPAGAVEALAESLYEHIKHGDDEHRAWLRRESLAWCQSFLRPTLPPADGEHSKVISVTVKRVQTYNRMYDGITVVIGDLHLRCDAVDDRSIRLAKRLADDHQAWFQYDEHCAFRVRGVLGIKE